MTVAQFVGRTSDLLIFHGDFPGREQVVKQTLCPDGTGGYLCTGVQKLAQRVLLLLLTKKGSVRFDPEYGSIFMILAEAGGFRTVADVEQAFYGSKLDLTRQLSAAELDTDPLDERLDALELLNVTVAPGFVSLRIQMVTQAGSTYTFIAPITVVTR